MQRCQEARCQVQKRISVVIPAKNEAGTITKVITEVKLHADEVIVVDGHSSDATADLARQAGATVLADPGRGKGSGIREGIRRATGDVIVFIDADCSHDPADIPRLVQPLLDDRAEMVIGSRLLGGSDELHGNFSNYVRMVGAGFITLIINLRWRQELTDVENGFRALATPAARNLGLQAEDFDIEQEMVMKALGQKLRILEVPSHEYKRAAGQSKLPTWKGLKFLWRLFIGLF